MSMQYSGDNVTFPDGSVQNTAPNGTGFKNRIINGAMVIDQRNAGAAVTTTSSFAVDRFINVNNTDGSFSAQQDTSVPSGAGFINSLKYSVTAADASLASTQYAAIQQRIEGLNMADLMWGTASAKTVTLSFWVRSSLTGTFDGSLLNSAADRSYVFTYTVSSANTWEYKTVTIPGDTTGTWLTTNGVGMYLMWDMGTGSTYQTASTSTWLAGRYQTTSGVVQPISNNGATFYITGVQLEKGSTATSFDYRPYGTELALCQRYFQTGITGAAGGAGGGSGSGYVGGYAAYQATMRSVATLTQSNQSYGSIYNNNISLGSSSAIGANSTNGFSHAAINGGGASTYYFTYTATAEL